MKRRGLLIMLLALVSVFSLTGAEPPHLGFIYPAGGRQGAVFEIIAGGKFLSDIQSAKITGNGVFVQVLEDPDKDLEIYRKEDLKKEISVLNSSKGNKINITQFNIKFDQELTQTEKNKSEREKRRKKKIQKNDQFPDTVNLRVAVMNNCEPGDHELFVVTPSGLSNKMTFQVGKLNEFNETEPNNRRDQANELPPLPVLINGRITQNDIDTFHFKAKKGQKLVINADVRKLIPFLADAVPGWFQASIALYDNKGNELAHSDNFRFNQEPVIFYTVPEDNEYYLEIRDSIYRGREDFVYRVSLGELPFITHISPIGGRFGDTTAVSIFGLNLPVEKLDVRAKDRVSPVQYIQVSNNGLLSNKAAFGLSGLPEVNKTKQAASGKYVQPVLLPVIVNGAIDIPGVKDYYSFEGKAGEEVYIEVIARRLGSPLDSIIALYNSQGRKEAENDDDPTYKWEGFITHHSDSALSVRLTKDDTYTVSIADLLGKGGAEYCYRLRISRPMPDFDLYSSPSSINIPQGGSWYFHIHALRKDGFTGPIRISMRNSSAGFKLDDAVLPEGKDDLNVSLSVSYQLAEGLTVCKLEGSADIQGKTVYRDVIPAEQYTQAFAYKHIVQEDEQTVLITPSLPFTLSFSVPKNKIFELTGGKESQIGVEVVRNPGFKENIQLQLVDAPEGISLRNGFLRGDKNKTTVILRAENKVNPGFFENLILSGTAFVPVEDKERPENKSKREKYFVTTPALTIVVLKEKQENQVQQAK